MWGCATLESGYLRDSSASNEVSVKTRRMSTRTKNVFFFLFEKCQFILKYVQFDFKNVRFV